MKHNETKQTHLKWNVGHKPCGHVGFIETAWPCFLCENEPSLPHHRKIEIVYWLIFALKSVLPLLVIVYYSRYSGHCLCDKIGAL